MNTLDLNQLTLVFKKLLGDFNIEVANTEESEKFKMGSNPAEVADYAKQDDIFTAYLYYPNGDFFGSISFTNEWSDKRDCSVSEIYDHSASEKVETLVDSL